MPTAYTVFYAVGDFTSGGYPGGLWISEDFQPSGTQPTWRKVSTGLPCTHIHTFAVDPFNPFRRQFAFVTPENPFEDKTGKQAICRRDTDSSDDWEVVLTREQATAMCGGWPDPTLHQAFDNLWYVSCDPAIPGRVYSLFSSAHYWGYWGGACSSPVQYPSYILISNDYGTTWSSTVIRFPNGQLCWDGTPLEVSLARGCMAIEGYNGVMYVGANCAVIAGSACIYYPATNTVSGDLGYSAWWPAIKIAPDGSRFYTNRGMADPSNQHDLLQDATTVLQDSLNLYDHAVKYTTPQNSDCLWIDPSDIDHMRMLQGNTDQVFVTHDGWATVDDASPSTLSPAGVGHYSDIVSPSDNPNLILIGKSNSGGIDTIPNSPIMVLDAENGTTLTDRGGDNNANPPFTDSLPNRMGSVANRGIWIGRAKTTGIYVYSVEMGEVGTERGIPLPGDRGDWRVEDYPTEHAEDIFNNTPHYHAPYPGSDGDVVRSDGSVWRSQPLTPADIGIEATQVGQVLISLDGSTFEEKLPVTDPSSGTGWLVDGGTGLLIVV